MDLNSTPNEYENVGTPWSPTEERMAIVNLQQGKSWHQIAKQHKRMYSEIRNRVLRIADDMISKGHSVADVVETLHLNKDYYLKHGKVDAQRSNLTNTWHETENILSVVKDIRVLVARIASTKSM